MAESARIQSGARSPTAQPKAAAAPAQRARGPTPATGGPPRVSLGGAPGTAPAVAPAAAVGAQLAAGEVDLSSGTLTVPEAVAAGVQEGGELTLPVRLPKLAEGTLRVRKRGESFSTTGAPQGILLRHPALARFASASPTVLVLTVKDNTIEGWVGLGAPGPAAGNKDALFRAMAKGAELLGWAGLTQLTFPTVHNRFAGGAIDVGLESLSFTVGGFLSGTGSAALDNAALSFTGGAKLQIPGGSSGELSITRDPRGELSGKLDLQVGIGSVSGTVTASLAQGFVSILGSVAYNGDRLSGRITLLATDEATARDITLKKPSGGGDVPIELPGPDTPVKPGKRAFCGFGQLTFRVTDWLAGTATVIVNSKGQATIVGEIAPPKEFILFPQKEWTKQLFKLEIRAGYGIPVVGQVGLFANISLSALAAVGPGKLYNIKLSGAYSTDPRVPKQLAIEGTLNISAFAGLRLRAEAGLVVTILGHDIKAGVGLNALAGVRGYVEATPRIGMREPAPGKREYYIQGHLEIAAQPVLGFSGDLFVAIETPWWSPLSDKRWTWPLFSIEYPLPGEFGIGADVDYVLGSKQWPTIEFGEVDFDGSKFLTDVMGENTDSGSGAETRQPGEWQEGRGGKGPGGAKNKSGSGKKPGEPDAGVEPIGQDLTFSDGKETHRLWFDQKGSDAALMMASSSPGKLQKKLTEWDTWIELLPERDRKNARNLFHQVKTHLETLDTDADRLAVMNEAARNAAATYKKNKNKKGPKKEKGKKGVKEQGKKVREGQKKARDPIKALATLLVTDKFAPIKRKAEMSGGKQEPVQIHSLKTHAGLQVSGKPGAKKIDEVLAGVPLSRKTNNEQTSGHVLLTTSAKTLTELAEELKKSGTKDGMVLVRVWDTLQKPADKATSVVADIGRRIGIPSLERARLFVPVSGNALRPLQFNPKPKNPDKAKKIFGKPFVVELQRQLKDQQKGLNDLSVYEWIANLAKFSVDERAFRALDTKGRENVLVELMKRTKAASLRAQRTRALKKAEIATLEGQGKLTKKQQKLLDKAKRTLARTKLREAAIREAEREILAAQEDSSVTPARAALKAKFDNGDDMNNRIGGRQGAERAARASIPKEALRALLEREKELSDWDTFAQTTSDLALLHRPDQVAGGYDRFKDLPEEVSSDDPVKWNKYLDDLKKLFGPSEINSHIGRQWTKDLIYSQALVDVRKAVPIKMSYPLHRLAFKLTVQEPS